MPASAPGDRVLELVFEDSAELVALGAVEVLIDVTGVSVSDPEAELEVVVVDEEAVLEDEVVEEDVVEEDVVEEEDEGMSFWIRLHLTVED